MIVNIIDNLKYLFSNKIQVHFAYSGPQRIKTHKIQKCGKNKNIRKPGKLVNKNDKQENIKNKEYPIKKRFMTFSSSFFLIFNKYSLSITVKILKIHIFNLKILFVIFSIYLYFHIADFTINFQFNVLNSHYEFNRIKNIKHFFNHY